MSPDYFASPKGYRIQKTIRRPVVLEGVGLHTGEQTRVRLVPAGPNHGIVFERRDLERPARIFAHYGAVVGTELATTLGFHDWPEARIRTVEHVLAALFAMGITNLTLDVTGSEIPILDGSAGPFVEAILDAGVELQPYSHRVLKVLKPIKVYQNGAICELLPRDRLRLTTSIDFAHPSIGLQTFGIELTPQAFKEEIAIARTFGFLRDVERLKSHQLAQGASLENVLAFSETSVLNPGGVRYPDECVRHKLLDAIGDLALCGCWIEGELVSYRGGHSIHLALLKALQDHRSNWELLPAAPLKIPAYAPDAARPDSRIVSQVPLFN